MSLDAQTLFESPDYYPLKFEGNNLVFVKMTRGSYQQSIFTLPNRIVTDGNQAWSIPFTSIVNAVEQSKINLPNPSVIFQIAHCGSTLLSRALDQTDSNLVIRESFALRQYCASPLPLDRLSLASRRRGLNALWSLLSRKYSNNSTVLLKTNVPVNFALAEINEFAPSVKGILLHCSFSDYLLSTLKSEQRRLWAKHVVSEMAPRIKTLDGFSKLSIDSKNAAQATAILWLSQMRNYQSALEQNSELRTLDSELLFKAPSKVLFASSEHLLLGLNEGECQRIAAGDLFSRHAKTPELSYTAEQRINDMTDLRNRFKEEIQLTQTWCEQSGFDTSFEFKGQRLI